MSTIDRLTPAGGVVEVAEPASTRRPEDWPIRYVTESSGPVYEYRVPSRPSGELLLDVEIGVEDDIVFMNAVDLDVAVEAADHLEAIRRLIDAVGDWLTYLRDSGPALSPELESQRRYVALLDHPPGTWFKVLFSTS